MVVWKAIVILNSSIEHCYHFDLQITLLIEGGVESQMCRDVLNIYTPSICWQYTAHLKE